MFSRLLKSSETSVAPSRRLICWRPDVTSDNARSHEGDTPGPAAADLIAAARARAESIIQEALEASSSIAAEAHQQGLVQGKADGYGQGLREAEALIAEANEALQDAMEQKDRLIADAEQEIVALSMKIAQLILKREIKTDPESVLALVRDALMRVRDEGGVTVRLNPVDAVVVRGHLNGLLSGTGVRQVSIEEDATMEPSGCVVSTSRGEIDERMESQMKRIATALEGVERDGSY